MAEGHASCNAPPSPAQVSRILSEKRTAARGFFGLRLGSDVSPVRGVLSGLLGNLLTPWSAKHLTHVHWKAKKRLTLSARTACATWRGLRSVMGKSRSSPPRFFMSRQNLHVPQSSRVHPAHPPQRLARFMPKRVDVRSHELHRQSANPTETNPGQRSDHFFYPLNLNGRTDVF